jgi:type I restriction enzyme S subunit
MSAWRNTTLGDFVALQRGHDLTDSERRPGDVPVMGSAGANGCHDTVKAKGPGVVIGRSGASFGQVHFCPVDYWPHNTALYVTDFCGNDPRFAYYFLKSLDFSRFNSGSAQPSLNRNFIYPIPVCIPEPNEQCVIASILGTLDDKIELNRRMNETLEALAQSLFKSWFVDATQSALPKGWGELPLPEAIEVNPSRPLRKGEVVPYLEMANMPTSSARALEVVEREFGSGMRFKNGDTLVARITPCFENGKTCFVDFLEDGQIAWGSTEYIVLQPKPPLPPEFAYFLARSEEFRAFMISNMTGTTGRQRVPAECLSNFKIAVPPVALAERFGQFASGVFAQMKAHDEESRTLAAMRDALLPKLLSGELRVPALTTEKGRNV